MIHYWAAPIKPDPRSLKPDPKSKKKLKSGSSKKDDKKDFIINEGEG
jgi:hypothetical protein